MFKVFTLCSSAFIVNFEHIIKHTMFSSLLNMFYVHEKYTLNIALFHGFLIRNYNSSYEQMIAAVQR